SAVIVPIKQGNWNHRDPDLRTQGRAAPEIRIVERKQYGCTEILCTVNETAADSKSHQKHPIYFGSYWGTGLAME
ncbi:hypothetical protein ACYULU_11845, partial [Breznakiellaceae bacterium SP9]